MPWSVQRQSRPTGLYYSALWVNEAKVRTRSVTVGRVAGDPPTAALSARLREHDPEGKWKDVVVAEVCLVADDDAIRTVLRAHRGMMGGVALPSNTPSNTTRPPAPPKEPVCPQGGMLLRDYVADVWEAVREQKAATWKRETWWWNERILPKLGDVRLCDLDEPKWTAFLRGLSCSGKSKTICQTAYRTAITYAADELGWVDGVHRVRPVEGSTKKVFAEPEPLTLEEVSVFLDATLEPVHRALFAVQIGQGLRCGEVLRIEWSDVRWSRRELHVRGTKNKYAEATVPLTPLAHDELLRWWKACGEPKAGLVFTHSGGKPFALYPRKAFYATAKRSGLNADRRRGLFPYSARHAFATIAVRMNTGEANLKLMLRHTDASTVAADAYVRVKREDAARALAGFTATAAK